MSGLDLPSKKILVTGGGGFLGKHVVQQLKSRGCKDIFVPRRSDFDLTQMDQVKAVFQKSKPEVIIHMAAEVGGIGANLKNPGRFFYSNLMMGVQLMEMARISGIEKFVALGTICAYPKFTPVPFKEENIWDGYPEETNAPYGLAKKMLLVMSQGYRQQYNFNSIYLLPVNLYGPQDNFDLESSHVIPAIIRKCADAIRTKNNEVVLWGSGEVSREFLYVEDAAEGIILATEKYASPEPVNLGVGFEIKIKDLAALIGGLMGFKGRFVWNSSKPDGQPRRCLDVSRAKKEFGFTAKTSLEDGLAKTINWYNSTIKEG
jgi:GDP-L-fucose synthase